VSAPQPAVKPAITWPLVALVSVCAIAVVALVLGLVVTGAGEDRAETFSWLSSIVTLIVGGGVVGVGAQVRGVKRTTETVRHQTNGSLDARLRDAALFAVETALSRAGHTDETIPAHTRDESAEG